MAYSNLDFRVPQGLLLPCVVVKYYSLGRMQKKKLLISIYGKAGDLYPASNKQALSLQANKYAMHACSTPYIVASQTQRVRRAWHKIISLHGGIIVQHAHWLLVKNAYLFRCSPIY